MKLNLFDLHVDDFWRWYRHHHARTFVHLVPDAATTAAAAHMPVTTRPFCQAPLKIKLVGSLDPGWYAEFLLEIKPEFEKNRNKIELKD